MIRILIVDDERIARDSVFGLLSVQEDLEPELLMAESAAKAVSILENERVDLCIMDINMPQMTGLELYEIVRKNWPQCKVIFLTGYSEFDYVYKVHKHAKYVLKADREEVLLEAVRESVQELENEMLVARAADLDPEFKLRAGLYRAGAFLNELIDGFTDVRIVTDEILRDMNIPLVLEKKCYAVLMRCEEIADADFDRRQLISEQIILLLERYFMSASECAVAEYKKSNYLLILQPRSEFSEATEVRRIASICSLFQNALLLNANTSAAILVPDQAMSFQQIIRFFGLFLASIGTVEPGDTQLYACERDGGRPHKGGLSDRTRMQALRAAIKLDHLFETGNREETLRVIRQIRDASGDVPDMQDLLLLEIYYRIAAELLGLVKQLEFQPEDTFLLRLDEVLNVSFHKNWERAFTYLEEATRKVFDLYEKNHSEQQEGLVARIKDYINAHISGDTSLSSLADNFHFSQEYLLRVFKKEEGVTILQYINELKLARAKELLADQKLQIKEIAQMLGFSDTGYFNYFFRSKTGLSPRTYRKEIPGGRP